MKKEDRKTIQKLSQGGLMKTPRIAVILSGCGHMDGSEVHEATLTLWAIHKHGADFQCFAPDIPQYHVLNHLSGNEMDEIRNVLIESARIARGNILKMDDFIVKEYDALILPGGFGAAKNLSDYAFKGADCRIDPGVKKALQDMREARKPIGALCIAPVLLARLFPGITVTIGQDASSMENIMQMGASHTTTMEGEIVIDTDNRIVTTPCYMLNSRVDKIGEGADKLTAALLRMLA